MGLIMSYEGEMLAKLKMPSRKEVEEALLIALFNHNGVIKEFSSAENIVNEIANDFNLNEEQREAYLETIYRKENRLKKSLLWHRLLFRAADSLAKEKLVSRPTKTLKLTNKREWMLTEDGFDKVLQILKVPIIKKDVLPTKSYEVQKIVNKLNKVTKPEEYNPIAQKRKIASTTKKSSIRTRGFRHAVIEAYDYKCAVCGLKICTPDFLFWEVEAAHIVPHYAMGKDDIWNGLALCRLHHWAFDVGWFTLHKNYRIQVSSKVKSLPLDYGKIGDFELLESITNNSPIFLPFNKEIYPHEQAMYWHRNNVFYH